MADVIVSNVSDIKLDVLSEGEISLTLADVPDINVQFEVTQGPSGPKGDTGDISPELQALADAAALSATQAAASAANASQIVLGQATGLPNVIPTLNLDFANSKILDNRVTFTRASTATYYDGKTVAKAEENLLRYSQEFDNSLWVKSSTTVTANNAAAPDGTATAETVSFTDSSGALRGYPAGGFVNGVTYTVSIFARSVSGNTSMTFDFQNAQVTSPFTITGTWTRYTHTFIASANREWWDIQMGGTAVVELWGAQVEQRSSVTAYTPTTTQPITNYVPVLLTAPANSPRFDHNPVTGESLGLLIEEQRANLMLRSQEFITPTWNIQQATVTNNVAVAPDGSLTAALVVADAGYSYNDPNARVLSQFLSVTGGTAFTWSIYAKAAGVGSLAARNNWTGGFAVFNLTDELTTSNKQFIGNGWYRCFVTYTPGATSTNGFSWRPFVSGSTADGVGGVLVWGAQLEAGAFPTSYIKTEASQVTRSADSATMTGVNFSSWYRQDEGTLFASWQKATGSLNIPASVGGDLNSYLFGNSANATSVRAFVRVGGVNEAELSVSGLSDSNTYAVSYARNDAAMSVNGAAVVTDTSCLIPQNMSTLRIGTTVFEASRQQHIRRIAYWPKRLTNSELQALTAQ